MKQLNVAIENILMKELKIEALEKDLTLPSYVSKILEKRKKWAKESPLWLMMILTECSELNKHTKSRRLMGLTHSAKQSMTPWGRT